MQQQTKEANPISLTEKAAKKVKYLLEKEDKKSYGLRVGILHGGCSGYMYNIAFEKSSKKDDMVIEEKGIKIFIDPQSMDFMKGSVVDYADNLQNAGFKVNNPNVKTSCGCGHSVG